MAEKVLWLSSKKWKYPIRYESSDLPSPEFHYFNISEINSNWHAILSCPEEWSHAIVVLTEPLLLLMSNDTERKKTLYNLFEILTTKKIEHSIIMMSNTYNGNIEIFNTGYYSKYIYDKLYKIHRDAFFRAINNVGFWNTGTLLYRDFITDYLVALVSQLHDHQYYDYAGRIADKAGNFFDTQEKALIHFPSSQLIIVDHEETMQTDIKNSRLGSEYNQRRGFWERRLSSSGSMERELDALIDWDEIGNYLFVYGRHRDSFQSKKLLENTLDDKVFQSLISCLGLDLSNQDKESQSNSCVQVVQELKKWEGLHIFPIDGTDDMFSYLDDYLGSSRFIVFSKYVLHDSAQADTFDRLMILFEKYVVVHQKINLKFDRSRTSQGTFYVVKSFNPQIHKADFSTLEDQFYSFLDNIQHPSDIQTIAKEYNIPSDKAESIIQTYLTETTRLLKDANDHMAKSLNDYRDKLIQDYGNSSTEVQEQVGIIKHAIIPGDVHQFGLLQTSNPVIASFFRGSSPNKTIKEIERIIDQYEEPTNRSKLHEAVLILNDTELEKDARRKAERKVKKRLDYMKKYLSTYERGIIDEWLANVKIDM